MFPEHPVGARNSKHPEPKPKLQNPKPSRDPTNPNHPIASLVPAHVPDQLQPKAFRIHDSSRSRTASVPFAPDDQAVRDPTANSSRPRSAARVPDQPLATSASIRSQSARVQASSRPVQLEVHSLVVRFQQSTKLKALLRHHDYTKCKVVVYSAVVKAYAKTFRFRDKVLKKVWTHSLMMEQPLPVNLSLYMGVPCIIMAGTVHAHNVGVSLLSKRWFRTPGCLK
ncbi:hypothetical protein F2Q69_00040773 [Brassica cretica]|uniref:Uncharacterized protein n=1 Tax=Brassica cretica TaxID=69181 RepID=A0A8S9N9I3_BRACR|nr:hypothetical protein F2Q69_00040773 [Brassica cretica]